MSLRTSMLALAVVVGSLTLPADADAQKKKSRDILTREELMGSAQKDQDLLAAIRALRPHFLAPPRGVRSLGGASQAPLAVYVDGIKQTGIDALYQLMVIDIQEARYLDPSQSENAYGIRANGGAVVVRRVDALAKRDST